MRIGELSQATGVAVRTIRFYEERGLLPDPGRSDSGYRRYSEDAVAVLRFVRSAKAAGLTLSEIQSILRVRQGGNQPCAHTVELLEAKLEDIDKRLLELREMRADVVRLVARSETLDPAACGPESICQVISTDV